MKRVFITTGDLTGIGLEITIKSLIELGPQKNVQFVLWRAKNILPWQKNLLNRFASQFNVFHHLPTEKEKVTLNLLSSLSSFNLIDISSAPTPTQWVVHSAKICLSSPEDHALVTAPLSKTQISGEGFKEKGHTDLLKNLSQVPYVFMTFLGQNFNIILLTGHINLRKISIDFKTLKACIQLCFSHQNTFFFPPSSSEIFHPSLQKKMKSVSLTKTPKNYKKIGCLGLNPHAGENGLLGYEDISIKQHLRKWGRRIEGPLVPDVAFQKKYWPRYFTYLCLYHDQGLIPFKMIHEKKSLQLSLGLPFVRTSVSHGCAKDIFNANKADPHSMTLAISKAITMLNFNNTSSKEFSHAI